jgi:hypothetical protein
MKLTRYQVSDWPRRTNIEHTDREAGRCLQGEGLRWRAADTARGCACGCAVEQHQTNDGPERRTVRRRLAERMQGKEQKEKFFRLSPILPRGRKVRVITAQFFRSLSNRVVVKLAWRNPTSAAFSRAASQSAPNFARLLRGGSQGTGRSVRLRILRIPPVAQQLADAGTISEKEAIEKEKEGTVLSGETPGKGCVPSGGGVWSETQTKARAIS